MSAETLSEAKKRYFDNLNEGSVCPCCERFGKKYERALYSTIVYQLLKVFRTYGTEWVHVNQLPRNGQGDFAKLRFWGFVEEQPKAEDKDAKNSGVWRVTRRGIDFLKGRLQVKSHYVVYNRECLELKGNLIGVQDALGKKFSYRELMGME